MAEHLDTGESANLPIIAIIEDDDAVCRALSFQLGTAGYDIAAYASAEIFLETADSKKFDCIVVDICLPKLNGLQLLAQIKATDPAASIIFITAHGDLSTGVQAMREGAIDCLEKPLDDQRLLDAVRHGVSSASAGRADQVRRLELARREATLTPRERDVFVLITAGLLNKQVGAELGPSEHTVKKHRARVMQKMGADSLADLVRMAEVLRVHDSARPTSSAKH